MRTRQINVAQLYWSGARRLIKQALEAERGKVGFLRGGNCGLMDEGMIVGKCARLSLLRMKGMLIEVPDFSKELMFEGGHTSEDSWTAVLLAAWNGRVLREAEVPIRWETANGTAVSGRPDIVLASAEGEPLHGIELKLVCAFNTAATVLSDKPKCMHLIQAGHYSWQLGYLPWDLWYTNRVEWPAKYMLAQKLKDLPSGENPAILRNSQTGKPEKVLPFRTGFALVWNDQEELTYMREGTTDYTVSIITPARLRAYYDFIAEMEETGTLGPRPTNMEADGSRGHYDICAYCPLNPVCSKTEGGDFSTWLQAAQEFSEQVENQIKILLAEEEEFV